MAGGSTSRHQQQQQHGEVSQDDRMTRDVKRDALLRFYITFYTVVKVDRRIRWHYATYYCASPSHWCTTRDPLLPLVLYVFDGLENFSLHFIAQQLKIQMRCVQYATYSSLGGCSKARSALTTAPCNEKEKNTENKIL